VGLGIVEKMRGQHIKVLEEVSPHQFEHFIRDAGEGTGEGMFPPVLFAARVGLFHA